MANPAAPWDDKESMKRLSLMLLILLLLGGCQAQSPNPDLLANPDPAIALHAEIWGQPLDLPEDLNSVRAAAMYRSLRAPIDDPIARREIKLHGALYRLAFESKSARSNRYCLLEPVRFGLPLKLAISPREFRLQVLGGLADLDASLAWGESVEGEPSERESFPSTRHQATRLRIRFQGDRNDSSSPIRGVISDWTVGLGASQQGFTAIWDGSAWQITRDRVRLAW